MPLAALDPVMLVYQDWPHERDACRRRISSLVLHRQLAREYSVSIAMSSRLCATVIAYFPWEAARSGVDELRDLREMLFQDLARVPMLDEGEECESEVLGKDLTSEVTNDPLLLDSWHKLLASCILVTRENQDTAWVAICDERGDGQRAAQLTILSASDLSPQTYALPLVWDEETWAEQVSSLNLWPDLDLMVRLHLAKSTHIRSLAAHPLLSISPAPQFRKDLERECEQPHLREALVRSLTKLACGIRDKGLGDEEFKSVRRFRVTREYRVHYRREGDTLVLLEFGTHDIGIKP